MTSIGVKRTIVLWALTFILLSLGASLAVAQEDSADVAIVYTTAYPGTFDGRIAWVEIWLDNGDFSVAGFQFMITLSNVDLVDFHTDSIVVEEIVIPVDTCSGPEPHGEECYVDSTIWAPVRFCAIDTAGCLTSGFEIMECHGDTGDTSLPDCNWIEILGMAPYGEPIEPYSGGWRCLLRMGLDMTCLSDTVSDRSTAFFITPGGNSFLSDEDGELIPFRYQQGELMAWFGREGDANADSTIDIGDAVRLLDYLYRGGAVPCIPESADPNGDCQVELGDVVQLITYLFRNGPAPQEGCWHGPAKDE
jgi:hypothetical protein